MLPLHLPRSPRPKLRSAVGGAGLLVLGFVALLLARPDGNGVRPDLALVGATLVDGTGSPPVPDAVVLVEGGRIACAGSRAACPVPEGVRLVDLAGRWIAPGLIDAHVHYSQTGWADGRPDALDVRDRFGYAETVAALEERPERFHRAYLCSGVTAVFDVGGYPWTWDLREPGEGGDAAPHVAAAGPLLSTIDHWVNVPAEKQFVHMASDSATVAAAGYLVANRTDAVKVWYLTGGEAPDTTALKSRLRAAAGVARAARVPLIVHATGLWQAKDALRAGAGMLVHSVYEEPVDEEFLDLARESGAIYVPTLVVFEGYRQLRHRDFDPARYGDALACVDPETRAKAFLTDSLPGAPAAGEREAIDARYRETRRMAVENLRRVHEAGIPVALGTDAGNPLTLHGPSVFLEAEAMAEAGLSPMEVLVAATRDAALAMGRSDDLGTLETGKVADLVVLAADPTADAAHLRSIESVVRNGTWHSREDLRFPR
ncbi:MAG: amidohydrolase family protein [Gemmatimonadetes bacterium]|nr:amidohydrolase family protein [Gemmatimonadota bacterium]